MSSTHIQLGSDNVVSVHTQSITARSSTRKGTSRKLWATRSETYTSPHSYPRPFGPQGGCSPLEEEEVQIVVLLGEEVAKDASGIATTDLVG